MKIDERELEYDIENALGVILGGITGVVTINVESGFIRWINLDIEQDDEEDN